MPAAHVWARRSLVYFRICGRVWKREESLKTFTAACLAMAMIWFVWGCAQKEAPAGEGHPAVDDGAVRPMTEPQSLLVCREQGKTVDMFHCSRSRATLCRSPALLSTQVHIYPRFVTEEGVAVAERATVLAGARIEDHPPSACTASSHLAFVLPNDAGGAWVILVEEMRVHMLPFAVTGRRLEEKGATLLLFGPEDAPIEIPFSFLRTAPPPPPPPPTTYEGVD